MAMQEEKEVVCRLPGRLSYKGADKLVSALIQNPQYSVITVVSTDLPKIISPSLRWQLGSITEIFTDHPYYDNVEFERQENLRELNDRLRKSRLTVWYKSPIEETELE